MPEVVDTVAVPSNLIDFSYEKIIANQKKVNECHVTAQKYLKKYAIPEKAAKHLISAIAKQCGAFGALTGCQHEYSTVGVGIDVLDWYGAYGLELKMVLSIAIIMGYDIADEEVKTFVLEHLAITSVSRMVRGSIVQVGTKTTIHLIDSIPGKSLTKVNRILGHRAITKRGTTGAFNLITYAFIGGMLVGATFDCTGAYMIGYAALHKFQNNDLPKVTVKELDRK